MGILFLFLSGEEKAEEKEMIEAREGEVGGVVWMDGRLKEELVLVEGVVSVLDGRAPGLVVEEEGLLEGPGWVRALELGWALCGCSTEKEFFFEEDSILGTSRCD